MTTFCPKDIMKRSEAADECSCLPVRGVEQDLAFGVSPLGKSHQGCVKVKSEFIFKNLKGSSHYCHIMIYILNLRKKERDKYDTNER